jgi:hypothetical protein
VCVCIVRGGLLLLLLLLVVVVVIFPSAAVKAAAMRAPRTHTHAYMRTCTCTGASTDPLKVAWFRAAMRLRRACVDAGNCTAAAEPYFHDFERLLIKVSEHTWGWNDGQLRRWQW